MPSELLERSVGGRCTLGDLHRAQDGGQSGHALDHTVEQHADLVQAAGDRGNLHDLDHPCGVGRRDHETGHGGPCLFRSGLDLQGVDLQLDL